MSLAVPQSYADLKALVSRMRTAGFSSHFNASFDATMAKVDAVEAARQRGEDAYAIKQLEEKAMSNISKVINKSNQSYNETLADIQTKAANYANFAATPEAANSTEAKQRAAALARDIEGFNANFAGLQEPYVAPTLKANKSGYLEQVNESGATKSSAIGGGYADSGRSISRSGRTLKGRQEADGTWSIVDGQTGEVVKSGIADATEVNRQMTEMNAGFAEPAATTATGGSSITGSSAADDYLNQLANGVAEQEKADMAKGIQITPEMRALYLQTARDAIAPYTSETIRNAEFDLGTSLTRLVEDTRTSELALSKSYQRNLETQTGNLQDAGLLYGGIRQKKEADLADAANTDLAGLGTTFSRGLQDASVTAERTLGSAGLEKYGASLGKTQDVGRVIAGSPVFTPGQDTNLYKPQGGQYGSFTRQTETDVGLAADELEGADRERFSQFS